MIKKKHLVVSIFSYSLISTFFFGMALFSCKNDKQLNLEINIKNNTKKHLWGNYRGVNVGWDITEEDIKDLSKTGANLIRYSTPVCTFLNMEEPYNYNEAAFSKLDSILNWGETYGVDVLIDPHRYPGTKHKWTMLGNDPFFQDFKYHDILIHFWERLAKQCAHRGTVIAGYDLLNEPQIDLDMKKNTPADLNLLYKKLTNAIREIDSVHTIVYALPRIYDKVNDSLYGYHKGITMFEVPDDDNICLETHTYMPVHFTHQNIWEEGKYVPYPTTINGIVWDKEFLIKEQQELIDFSIDNPKTPILVGEFSSPRWTGQDGLNYLTDVIEIAETHNWSWAYHAYRENQVWDPEMNITDRNDSIRIPHAPRIELLKEYFSRNKKN